MPGMANIRAISTVIPLIRGALELSKMCIRDSFYGLQRHIGILNDSAVYAASGNLLHHRTLAVDAHQSHLSLIHILYDPATYKFEWGKANTVVDNGSDMTMIVSGILLKKALDAAAILKEQGIGVRVLDMATIKPLDKEAVLKAAGETGAIMTIEDCLLYTSRCV